MEDPIDTTVLVHQDLSLYRRSFTCFLLPLLFLLLVRAYEFVCLHSLFSSFRHFFVFILFSFTIINTTQRGKYFTTFWVEIDGFD